MLKVDKLKLYRTLSVLWLHIVNCEACVSCTVWRCVLWLLKCWILLMHGVIVTFTLILLYLTLWDGKYGVQLCIIVYFRYIYKL